MLEMRGLTGRKHGGKIDSAMLTPLLDAAEEWLYTDEGERASADELTTKLAELRSAAAPATARYYEAVAADKTAEEAALETAAVQAAAERAAAGEDEDHDTRELVLRDRSALDGLPIADETDETDEIDEIGVPLRLADRLLMAPSPLSLSLPTGKLKFPDRMRLVSKNKDEGTELFKGAVDVAQFRAAAARYNKALTHASKFVDLSPDQREEVNAMKLSLHLNVAACWLKITDADNHLDQVR